MSVGDAWDSYYDSEMERWEETKDDPAGTLYDNFLFGLTGPASSLDSEGNINHGPEPYSTINEETHEALDEGVPEVGDVFDTVLPWWLPVAVAGGGVLVLLFVLRPYASIGAAALG